MTAKGQATLVQPWNINTSVLKPFVSITAMHFSLELARPVGHLQRRSIFFWCKDARAHHSNFSFQLVYESILKILLFVFKSLNDST